MTIFKKKNLLSLAALAAIAISLISGPASASAQSYTPLSPLPCIESATVPCPGGNGSLQTNVTFQNYVQYAFNLAIFLSAAAAVFMIVWGGFEYTTSASFQTKSAGLDKVKNALLGLVLVLASYLILRTIDPRLVAIPTTLVQQLDIKNQTSSTDLLASLDTNNYLANNAKAKADIAALQTDLAAQNAKQSDVESKIVALAAKHGISNATVDQMCGPSGVSAQSSDAMQALCYQRVQTKVNISNDNAAITLTAGQGVIAGKAAECLDSQILDASVCAQKIRSAADAANNKLQSMNRTYEQKQINDYAAYTTASLQMTAKLREYNPNLGLNANFALNALVPGGDILNSMSNVFVPDSKTAYGTVNAIKSIADNAQITDPALKAQLAAQAAAIQAKIGGFGTGVPTH